MNKKQQRLRRAKKTRFLISNLQAKRLSVFRTNKHIYAQILDETGANVLAQVSTLSDSIISGLKDKKSSNVEAAKLVGSEIAKLALAKGVKEVAFDRSGFRYHGRIKAVAELAREGGLVF